jgi:hypothetical protein
MKSMEIGGGSRSVKKLGNAKAEEEVQERCKATLEAIAAGRVKHRASDGDYYIELPPGGAALWVILGLWEDNCIAIRIYPGNIVKQAQEFFERVNRHEFFRLKSKGWTIEPYLVFCYIATEVCRAEGNKLGPEQYFDYWKREEIRQVRRENNGFEDLSQRLRVHRLIDARDQRNIRRGFTETKRDFMNVCPGFELIFAWRRTEANRLDRNRRFIEAVRDRANEALRTWGQTL